MTSPTDAVGHDKAREWIRTLAAYRDSSLKRSVVETTVTIVPLLALWTLGAILAGSHPGAALVCGLLSGLFIIRAFVIQHDCGHGAFLANRKAQDCLGRILGIFTCTPYLDWKYVHSVHHAHSGHLDRRGMGDVYTMTVSEYREASRLERVKYRIYRHPVFLFGIAPSLLFVLQQRLPHSLKAPRKFWISTMGTNAGLTALLGVFWLIGGFPAILLAWLPGVALAAAIGVWLFYVQHQFEETMWDREGDWDMHESALHGASHYVMPAPLRWFSGNIGIHHIHHLFSRIPFYRLPEVLKDYPELADMQVLTIPESFSCARRHLWDENSRRLLTFKEAARA